MEPVYEACVWVYAEKNVTGGILQDATIVILPQGKGPLDSIALSTKQLHGPGRRWSDQEEKSKETKGLVQTKKESLIVFSEIKFHFITLRFSKLAQEVVIRIRCAWPWTANLSKEPSG